MPLCPFPLNLLPIDFNIISNKPTRTPEQQKMDIIQENYINDKEALTNEGRSLPTGQQMLAKSKSADGRSSGGGKKSTKGGRALNEASSNLSDELITKIENNIL